MRGKFQKESGAQHQISGRGFEGRVYGAVTFEEDLAKDVLEIITVFSARLYGSRSRKNQKLLDGVKKAVEDSQS